MSVLRDEFKKLTGENCKLTSSFDAENKSFIEVKMFNPRYVDWLERRLANGYQTSKNSLNISDVMHCEVCNDIHDVLIICKDCIINESNDRIR